VLVAEGTRLVGRPGRDAAKMSQVFPAVPGADLRRKVGSHLDDRLSPSTDAALASPGLSSVCGRLGERGDTMNRFVFVALMMASAPALAPTRLAPQPAVREPKLVTHVVPTPAVTWTCAGNTYRSVVCS
jgi:hypothetical protein